MTKQIQLKAGDGLVFKDDARCLFTCCDCGLVHEIRAKKKGKSLVLYFDRKEIKVKNSNAEHEKQKHLEDIRINHKQIAEQRKIIEQFVKIVEEYKIVLECFERMSVGHADLARQQVDKLIIVNAAFAAAEKKEKL